MRDFPDVMGLNRSILANLAAATAALSAGAGVVATRLAIGETDAVTLAFYRYLIAGLCLVPVLPFVWPRRSIPTRDLAQIAILGALFFGLFPWVFSAALQYTTAARGAIGLATIPIQTLIVAALFGKETLARHKFASIGLAFSGIAIIFGPEAILIVGSDTLRGDGLMLFGAFIAAIYSVFSQSLLRRYGSTFVTALAIFFGVLALFPAALVTGAVNQLPSLTREGWLALLFLGTLGGAVQFLLFSWALRWLSPTRAAIYLTLSPVSAMFLAVGMLGEQVTAILIFGLLFVISGVLVANWPRHTIEESSPRELAKSD